MSLNEEKDLLNSIERGRQLAQRMIMAPALYATILIVQFVARMHKANLLKKTDWENFDKFMKFCDYNVEVANIPLSEQDMAEVRERVDLELERFANQGSITDEHRQLKAKELVKEGIREKLDDMGIHYCMLENDFDVDYMKIYYKKSDKARMEDFLGTYIKEHLISGEMEKGELKRMMGEKTSIISVPDALEEKLQDAMKAVDVSFAKIEDLNLADGKKQMYIPNHQLQIVKQLYQEIRDGLIADGMDDPGDMEEMTQEELNATAICKDDQDFVERCDETHREVSDSFINEDSKTWEEVTDRFEPLGSKSSVDYMNNDAYEQISIDEQTLVAQSGAAQFVKSNSEDSVASMMFACKVPGTGYKNSPTQFLVIPKDQVFKDTHANRTRYVAFLEKDKKQMILDSAGKPVKGEVTMVDSLMEKFDYHRNEPEFGPSIATPTMKM